MLSFQAVDSAMFWAASCWLIVIYATAAPGNLETRQPSQARRPCDPPHKFLSIHNPLFVLSSLVQDSYVSDEGSFFVRKVSLYLNGRHQKRNVMAFTGPHIVRKWYCTLIFHKTKFGMQSIFYNLLSGIIRKDKLMPKSALTEYAPLCKLPRPFSSLILNTISNVRQNSHIWQPLILNVLGFVLHVPLQYYTAGI